MLDQGPVPVGVHGIVEYGVGVLFIASPFLFGFSSAAAPTAAAIVVGLLLLAFTATSALPTGLVQSVSIGVHVTVDLVLAVRAVHRRRGAPPAHDDRDPLLAEQRPRRPGRPRNHPRHLADTLPEMITVP
jgi:hypothetical protein